MPNTTAEPRALSRLHELSTRLLHSHELGALLEEVLDATIALLRADFGNVQLYDDTTASLHIVAQRGFGPDFLEHFARVGDATTACGRALNRREAVIIEDVLRDAGFAPHCAIAAASGFRSVVATPLFSRSGEPLGAISAHFRRPHRPTQRELCYADLYARQAADMIERKRAQDTLRASEERSRRYFEMGLVGMVTTSVSKGILEVNDELCRILGYDRRDLLRKTWAEMSHPDDLEGDLAQFERVLAGETDGYSLDKRWIRKDGQVIHSIMSMQCVRRPDGSIDHLLGLVLDTTERRRTEEALRRAREELAHLTRVTSMGELTAAIAHELNQPLAAIAANAAACLRWLSRKTPELEEARQALERILRDGERASEVLEWVRTFSRKNEPQKTPLDVNHVIREVLLLARPDAARHGVALHTELAESLPPVFGDRVQLQQVVLNLVMNGIEAMSERSLERPELVIRTKVEDAERVLVMVRDYGIGLQHGASERVFEPFYTTKSKGMGLGLTISRRIVEAHQGQLWASLNEGAGATFQFSVPVLPPAPA